MDNRQLQKWASIAEIVAAVAVVLSLIYVAIELNSNTRALQASIRSDFSEQEIALLTQTLDSRLLAEAIVKENSQEVLTDLEQFQLTEFYRSQFRLMEHAYYQYMVGTLEENEWDRSYRILRRTLCRDDQGKIAITRGIYQREFLSLAQEIIGSCDER